MPSFTDWRQFKTPFFEISVGDSRGQNMVTLPHYILRLVEKVEVIETFSNDAFNAINITFVEGSREPISHDSALGNGGLYNIDKDVGDVLNNRTAILTDLEFSNNNKIKFLTEDEIKITPVNNILTNFRGEEIFLEPKNSPSFLFRQYNQIKVTWGYRELGDLFTRSVRCRIIAVTVDFPENDQVRTIVKCGVRDSFDQIAIPGGTGFNFDVVNGGATSQRDPTLHDLLTSQAKKMGVPSVISKSFAIDNIGNDRFKLLMGDQSIDEQFKTYAMLYNARYNFIIDPATGLDTLVFMNLADFESKPVFKDPVLFTYKAPGSIIKSINLRVDYGGLFGASTVGTTDDGPMVSIQNVGTDQSVTYGQSDSAAPEKIVSADPVNSNNTVPAVSNFVKSVGGKGYAGIVENFPDTNPQILVDLNKALSERSNRLVYLDIATIGHPLLTPGVVEVGGIGIRYSGRYRIMTVIHTIDTNGYVCKASALNATLNNGLEVINTVKGEDVQESNSTEPVEQPKIVESASTPTQDVLTLVRDQYEKIIFKK